MITFKCGIETAQIRLQHFSTVKRAVDKIRNMEHSGTSRNIE